MKQRLLIFATVLLVAAIGAFAEMQVNLTEARKSEITVEQVRCDARFARFATCRLGLSADVFMTSPACVENLVPGATGVWLYGETQIWFKGCEAVTPKQSEGLWGIKFALRDGTILHAEYGVGGNAILFFGTIPQRPIVINRTVVIQGTPGATGPQGPQGPAGRDGRDGYNLVYLCYQQPQQAMSGCYAAPSPYIHIETPGASGMGGWSYVSGSNYVFTATGGTATGGSVGDITNNNANSAASTNVNNNGANIGNGTLKQDTSGKTGVNTNSGNNK